ncbi:LysR family transcriptional regulator [Blastopirellula sp. JC732]|uniref:LysR family transcriptional regulator n=1 Tax=Blastopirellula sediminis TaxID=2894196 RepID=A0A9X1MPN9_9BACT|nr:LysR family transcriptional regulator [Blastopirellula sediminis]MCC9605642.1 LysR family transcriptional regulator [Blastopirellula sediminis]MCC9631058.1 LysR family transcriptional regulator [Blastopirellula sediminis]
MNLHHLAIFHEIAETGSVSLGAENLMISQPAASKQLREFEAALGEQLFDRTGKGLRLTTVGKLLNEYARKIFTLEAEAEQAVAQLREVSRGELFVGASTTIAGYLLPQVLARFHHQHPQIRVHVSVGNTDFVHQQVLDYRVDLGLTEGFVKEAGLTSTSFAEDELVVVAAASHPLVKKRKVKAEDLSGQSFVLRESGSGTRAVQEQAISMCGVEVNEVMTLSSTEAIKHVVAAGVGLAIVSRLSVEAELASGELCAIRLADLQIPRPLHLVQAQDRFAGPAARAFRDVLCDL